MNQLGLTIVWCAIQVGAIGLLAWMLLAVTRRTAARARAVIAMFSLMVVALLSVLSLVPLPSWFDVARIHGAGERPDVAAAYESQSSGGPSQSDGDETGGANNAARGPKAAADPAVPSFAEFFFDELRGTQPAAKLAAREPRLWPTVVAAVFLALLALGGVQLAAGLFLVRCYRRDSVSIGDDAGLTELVDTLRAGLGCTHTVAVRQSLSLSTAATVGWLRPIVLLPRDWRNWNDDQRRAVLAHEIAHIARRDYLACLCGQVGLMLHYYHPAVHWLVRRMRLEQELAADAAAAAVSGGRKAYLRVLAELALRQPDHRLPLPVRSFLPSRSTFLRRIDMLRDPRSTSTSSGAGLAQLAAVLLLLIAAVAAAGLRGPGALIAFAQDAPQDDKTAAKTVEPFDLRYVSDSGGLVVAVRPARIAALPRFEELLRTVRPEFSEVIGMNVADIEEVIVAMSPLARATSDAPRKMFENIVIRAARPQDWKKLFDGRLADAQQRTYLGKTYFDLGEKSGGMAYFHPDDRTLVIAETDRILGYLEGDKPRHSLLAGAGWKRVEREDLAVALDPKLVLKAMRIEPANPATTNLAPVSPLLRESQGLLLGARLEGKQLTTQFIAKCDSESDTKEVTDTIKAALTLSKNFTREARRAAAGENRPEAALTGVGLGLAFDLLESAKSESVTLGVGREKTTLIQVQGQAEIEAAQIDALSKAAAAAKAAAAQTRAANNLKQIALAMYNYHDVYGHLPAASILGPDGKTPHSWRVAILPYIEQEALYKQYHLDEPWDSENNKKVLAHMPDVFRAPGAPKDATASFVYVLTGGDAIFSGKPAKVGCKLLEIHDGTSNTIMLVEAQRDIPWTKPEDVPYSPDKPLPKLGARDSDNVQYGTADGAVHTEKQPKTEKEITRLRALITKDGGEVVNW